MRRLYFVGLLFAFIATSAAQQNQSLLKISALLVDRDLNVKAVPKLSLTVQRTDVAGAPEIPVSTNLQGLAEIEVEPGAYAIKSTKAVEFQNKLFSWNLTINVKAPSSQVELSNDNAVMEIVRTASGDDDLKTIFKQYQDAVVTVWGEVGAGHGSGFVIDDSGLILTNQHVVSTSEFIAVEFDSQHKLRASLLASDPVKDVAVLWVNPTNLQSILPVRLPNSGQSLLSEGDRVYAIGSPLHQRKVITSGIVSKVEDRAIISDININHGNSGGPLFSPDGVVVGVTTFGDVSNQGGPGISGIVRIEQAKELIEEARRKMLTVVKPSAALLPNDPTDKYPIEAIKAAAQIEKFKTDPYLFGVGDYDVAVITPILTSRHYAHGVRAGKEKEKRNRKSAQAVQGTFEPLENLKGWMEYVGEYEPVLLIEARPKLRETFWSAFGRGLAASGGAYYTGPARLHFKTDFYRMKLFCGTQEVIPLAPGKVAIVLDEHNAAVNVTDATYAGLYKYPADAISSSCGRVELHIFSEKEPENPKIKVLETKTIQAVLSDFTPYINAQKKSDKPSQIP
jgi:S1-C subfamily serine protease